MTGRSVRAFVIAADAASLVCCAATVVLIWLDRSVPTLPTEFGVKGYGVAFAVVLGGVGSVIAVRRPANPIGRTFCGLAVVAGVMAVSAEYARWMLLVERRTTTLALLAAWTQEWLWIPLLVGFAFVAAVFPEGRTLSRRWRLAIVATTALAAVPTVLNALLPRLTIFAGFDNPVGVGDGGITSAANGTVLLVLPVVIVGATSAFVRFRRSHGEERQQIKWLVLAVSAIAILLAFYGVVLLTGAGGGNDASLNWSEYVAIVAFLGVPISIAFGVLKYRLYDIDIVINKAVVYGAIAVFITVVYAAVVVGIGAAVGSRGDPLLSALAAAIVALAFQPVRRRARRFANRVVYGERATPYEVLAELGERLAGEYATEDVLERIAGVIADGVGAERAVVWLRVGDRLRPAALRPSSSTAPDVEFHGEIEETIDGARTFEVRHQGRVLGALGVTKPASDPLTPGDEKLVSDVAAQAGLVMRNVALIEELRASRRRLVAAQDDERRRLERNIHDGAQQQLVSLAVKARLVDQLLERDMAKARELVAQIQAETTDALENLRDLARGIYPPLLADKGLEVALEAQARKSPIPVAISPDGIGRYAQDVEAAIYFCVLEALQNVAKYAEASRAEVRLAAENDAIRFEVHDDGRGFDPGSTAYGTGLQGMADRLDAVGGTLEVRSAPGYGTTIVGDVPVRRDDNLRPT